MTNSQNNHERTVPVASGDPGKTGDLSAAAQAVAVRAATKVAASRGGAQHVAAAAASAPAFGATSAPASLRRPTRQLPGKRLPENRLLKRKRPRKGPLLQSPRGARRAAAMSPPAKNRSVVRRAGTRPMAPSGRHLAARPPLVAALACPRKIRRKCVRAGPVWHGARRILRGVHGVPLRHRARPAKRSAPR